MTKKTLRKRFNEKDPLWRIEAVIHDGNWYDFKKWKKIAKVKEDKTLSDWIENNKDILIKSESNSYRVNYNEIIRWYEQEGIEIDEKIVPSNFPPKLWDGKTETDIFLEAPRRRVGTISFEAKKEEVLKKCQNILKGTAKVIQENDGRYKAYGLSATHMRNLLSKGLSEDEFNSLEIKTRAILLQRELIDLPREWLETSLDFYANKFAPSILKTSMPTISIYLKDKNDIKSQIVIWVITAMKKFDENASVPFSGYLNSVLRHWPYDLPNEHLGKDLAKFQRDRKKAIDIAREENDGDSEKLFSIEKLSELMNISEKEYITLNDEHETWLAEKNATALIWEDSANEKSGSMIGKKESLDSNTKDMFNISISAIKSALETEDWESAYLIISQIDTNDIDDKTNEKLSLEFIKSFSSYVGKS